MNSYGGSEGEQALIENYAIGQFQQQSRQDPAYASRNEDFYFVPRESYDPIDLAVSRDNAVAVFQFQGVNGDTDIRRLR